MIKTALITGASKGIGLELAKVHAEKGDNLVLVARNKDRLDELKIELEDKYGIKVYTIGKDLSLQGSPMEVYNEVTAHNILVDYLVNNAGFGDFGLFAESNWDRQESMISLNITALVLFTRLFLPDMIKRRSGKIMNVASLAAFQPGPVMSVYFASKAFVLSFSEAVNSEVKDYGITITALCPGSTESGFHAALFDGPRHLKNRKLPSSRTVAVFGYKAMMKGKAVAIHGIKNCISAFSVRLLPRGLVVKFIKMVQLKKIG